MSKLSKLIKKASKSPIVKGVVKLAGAAIAKKNPKLSGIAVRGAQVLKGAGISPIKPAMGNTKLPVSPNIAVNIAKHTQSLPKAQERIALPGGAPISGSGGSRTKKLKATAVKKPAKKKASKTASKATKSSGKKGTIGGSGSLDLKATSAKWKKAGKPGKWIDYVKSNGVRRK